MNGFQPGCCPSKNCTGVCFGRFHRIYYTYGLQIWEILWSCSRCQHQHNSCIGACGKLNTRYVLSRNACVALFVPCLTRHYLDNWSSTFFMLLSCGWTTSLRLMALPPHGAHVKSSSDTVLITHIIAVPLLVPTVKLTRKILPQTTWPLMGPPPFA